MPRITRGRQKVELKKIENANNLQVTFSKRRNGLFKKASELCTMCGPEMGLIVHTPGQKVFAFGHPNLEEVLDRFEGRPRPPVDPVAQRYIEEQRNVAEADLNNQITELMADYEQEKKRANNVNTEIAMGRSANWWMNPVEETDDPGQLQRLLEGVTILKSNIDTETQARAKEGDPTAMLNPTPLSSQFYYGQSSSSSVAPAQYTFCRDFFIGQSSSNASVGPHGPPQTANFLGSGSSSSGGVGSYDQTHSFFGLGSSSSSGAGPYGQTHNFLGLGSSSSGGAGPYAPPHTSDFLDPGNSASGGVAPYGQTHDFLGLGSSSSSGAGPDGQTHNFLGPGSSSSGGAGPYAAPHTSNFFEPGSSSSGSAGHYGQTHDFFGPGSSSSGGNGGPSVLQGFVHPHFDNYRFGPDSANHFMLQQQAPAAGSFGLNMNPTGHDVQQQPAPTTRPFGLDMNPNDHVMQQQPAPPAGPFGLNYDRAPGPQRLNFNYSNVHGARNPNDLSYVVDFGDNPNPEPLDAWDPLNFRPGGSS